MKKLNKKLQGLISYYKEGKLENYIDSLSPGEIGNYLHLIETKKRLIISENFRRLIILEKEIRQAEEEKNQNGSLDFQIKWLKEEVNEEIAKRQSSLKFWEMIEEKLSIKKKLNQKKRNERKKILVC